MNEMFKKGFGLIMGVYTACCAVNLIDGVVKSLVKNNEKTSEEEESKAEEEF